MRLLPSGLACALSGALVLGACGSDKQTSSGTTTGADGGTTTSSGGTSTPVGGTSVVTTTKESLTVNGTARLYILSVPKSYDKAKAYPLVMVLHGSPGDAAGEAAGEPFERSSGSDAILVYPQALNDDSGAFDWDIFNDADNNVDTPFLEALPAALKADKGLNIDTSKVFGFGYSGGAFFLQVYQCLGPKVFKAVVASAGGAPESLKPPDGPIRGETALGCTKCPGTSVPQIIIFGHNDGSNGGDTQAKCAAEQSGCSEKTSASTPDPCVKYDGCPVDKPVTYCNIPNVGHEDWSQAQPTAWDFFKTFL